jgi:hypothetical protein
VTKSGRRFVVLQFDDGDRFDYEPPLLHPADVFLERFPTSTSLNADIGATSAVEVDHSPEYEGPLIYPPQDPYRARLEAFQEWTD